MPECRCSQTLQSASAVGSPCVAGHKLHCQRSCSCCKRAPARPDQRCCYQTECLLAMLRIERSIDNLTAALCRQNLQGFDRSNFDSTPGAGLTGDPLSITMATKDRATQQHVWLLQIDNLLRRPQRVCVGNAASKRSLLCVVHLATEGQNFQFWHARETASLLLPLDRGCRRGVQAASAVVHNCTHLAQPAKASEQSVRCAPS